MRPDRDTTGWKTYWREEGKRRQQAESTKKNYSNNKILYNVDRNPKGTDK